MTLTALFSFFVSANANVIASVCMPAQVPAQASTGGGNKETRPKIAATVAIENVQSDDEPPAVV